MFALIKQSAFALLYAILFSASILACHSSVCTYRTPDKTAFDKAVLSPALRDSIRHSTIMIGMPYSVVRSVFSKCKGDTAIVVASSGSRQVLDESEGLFSHFHDPGIQIYLDKYRTSQGMLYIWYGNMNYYRAEIAQGDSVFLYSDSRIDTANVVSLATKQILRINKSMKNVKAIPYAEIHSREFIGKQSFLYDLAALDTTSIKQQTQSKAEYPVLHLELGSTVITSFHWK
jgi:hypothetical protein